MYKMQYLITFLEGIVTFVSPCILPLFPVYVSLFAAGESTDKKKTFCNALGFVLGFTILFTAFGALSGSIGKILTNYRTIWNLVTGLIVVLFGISYLDIFHLPFFHGRKMKKQRKPLNFWTAMIFGMTFSVSWTPCIGTFLGSALMLASQQASAGKGVLLLLLYSAGLGIPYVLCALLINRLTSTIRWIKQHYRIINCICGSLLIIVGILMMTGVFEIFFRSVNI